MNVNINGTAITDSFENITLSELKKGSQVMVINSIEGYGYGLAEITDAFTLYGLVDIYNDVYYFDKLNIIPNTSKCENIQMEEMKKDEYDKLIEKLDSLDEEEENKYKAVYFNYDTRDSDVMYLLLSEDKNSFIEIKRDDIYECDINNNIDIILRDNIESVRYSNPVLIKSFIMDDTMHFASYTNKEKKCKNITYVLSFNTQNTIVNIILMNKISNDHYIWDKKAVVVTYNKENGNYRKIECDLDSLINNLNKIHTKENMMEVNRIINAFKFDIKNIAEVNVHDIISVFSNPINKVNSYDQFIDYQFIEKFFKPIYECPELHVKYYIYPSIYTNINCFHCEITTKEILFQFHHSKELDELNRKAYSIAIFLRGESYVNAFTGEVLREDRVIYQDADGLLLMQDYSYVTGKSYIRMDDVWVTTKNPSEVAEIQERQKICKTLMQEGM